MDMPKLRFSSFKGEWKKIELKDILKVNSGKDYKHLNQGEIPVYGTGGYMLSVDKALSKEDAVGIGRKGSIDKPQRLKAPFWTVDTLFYCTPKNDSDLHFLFTLFNTINWKRYDESTGVPSLSKATIEKIGHYVPYKREQQEIGKYFELIDLKIQMQQEKVEAWREYKKGMIQKLFSRELRFKDEDGREFPKWEMRHLNSIITFFNGQRKPVKESNRIEGIYPYYGASGIISYIDDFIFEGEYLLLSEDGANIVTRNLPIVYRTAGKFWLNNHAHIFRAIDSFSNDFLYHALERIDYIPFNTGTAQPKLNLQSVKNIELKVPSFDEQSIIGEFLNAIDMKIDLELQKMNQLNRQKRAFMQKMFI